MARREEGSVLIVENDGFMRTAMERYCQGVAPTVTVSRFEKAVEALNQNLVAVIVNLGVANSAGPAVLEMIRECKPRLPVLALSGEADEIDLERARSLGVELLDGSADLSRLGDFLDRALNRNIDSEPRIVFG